MGRWAQRQRSGGGLNSPVSLIDADITDTMEATAAFNGNVNAAAMTSFSFESLPSGSFAQTIAQNGGAGLTLTFIADISADTDITYHGTAANTVFPTTINY